MPHGLGEEHGNTRGEVVRSTSRVKSPLSAGTADWLWWDRQGSQGSQWPGSYTTHMS